METSEQKRSYDRDGFLKVERLFSSEHMEEIDAELGRYMKNIVPGLPAHDIVYESRSSDGSRAIRNLWRMEDYSPFFASLVKAPELLQLIGVLVNGEPVSTGVELFAKPAKVGSAVPYHQDNGYFNLVPPDALTCWVAIDDSNLENGCVHYATGTHRNGVLPHKATMVPGNSWGLQTPPEIGSIPEVPGILSPGDAMIHHCCLLHRSEPNRSNRARRGLLMVFKGAHCTVDPVGAAKYDEARRAVAELQKAAV